MQKWASLWALSLGDLIKYSSFSQLGALASDRLQQILSTKAVSTLQRHLGGWKFWLDFAGSADAHACNPELRVVVGFFKGLAESSPASDAPLRAMRFAAGVMGWKDVLSHLETQAARAWTVCSFTRRRARRRYLAAMGSSEPSSLAYSLG